VPCSISIPLAVIVVAGAVAIVMGAQQAPRGSTHVVLLGLVLAENSFALLARRRHPLIALTAVLTAYALVDNEATTVLPVLLALFTVATVRDRRTVGRATIVTAIIIAATPGMHRKPFTS
jgi:hypothetical protein